MKKLLLAILIGFSTLPGTAQDTTARMKEMVKQEVKKLVSLIENNKETLQPYGQDFGILKRSNDFNHHSLDLVYHKDGSKDLYLDNYMDIGANGWGEPRNKNKGFDGLSSDDYDRTFLGWNKELQAMFLNRYLEKIKFWQSFLTKKI